MKEHETQRSLRSTLARMSSGCGWLFEVGSAFCTAFGCGVLKQDEFTKEIIKEWEDYANNNSAETPGLIGVEKYFYGRFVQPTHKVLLVGCGAGRDSVPLIELGIQVTGIDIAPLAIELCRRNLQDRGLTADLFTGSIETIDLGRRFDRVLFSWFSYCYIRGSSNRVSALRNVIRHLVDDGQLLVSYRVREDTEKYNRWCQFLGARTSAFISRSGWRPQVGDHFWLYGNFPNCVLHYEHRFLPSEIESEAQRAGLSVKFHETQRYGIAVFEQA